LPRWHGIRRFRRFGEQSEIPALLAYAVTVTIIAIIATILIGRAAARAQKREAEEKKE
jgi:MFS superfamily sulfate permease-like transporter